jgi:hypothetical protein
MVDERISDITLEVLINNRDEIGGLREDTNRRSEQMDNRFERIEGDIARIRKDISQM